MQVKELWGSVWERQIEYNEKGREGAYGERKKR